jgi:translation initiation factor IF-3
LIDTNGDQLGIMPVQQAQGIADDRKLDLVEVAGTANPPVCRIMDFHKYRYEERKKAQASKKKATASAVKEVKIRSRTEKHDIRFKIEHIKKFLDKGHRVKISVFFKGREITRPQLGRDMLDKVLETISDFATPEGTPRMEGRHMSVLVVPTKVSSTKAPAQPVEQAQASPESKGD